MTPSPFTTERPLTNDERYDAWQERINSTTEPDPDIPMWVTIFAIIAMTMAVLTAHLIWSAAEPASAEPACGMYLWTQDAHYVEHCDYHDGQGLVPRKSMTERGTSDVE